MQKAYFGGGCFWCVEAVFQRIKGVEKVVSGYAGGDVKNPGYREVTSGLTGHAEVVEIEFDESVISYRELLLVFFLTHDPTTLNRQGNDVGTQYRSVVFYVDKEQLTTLENFIRNEASQLWEDNIVTQIAPLEKFYKAEDYHQNYFNLHPQQAYCNYVIRPKVEKLKSEFQSLLKHEG